MFLDRLKIPKFPFTYPMGPVGLQLSSIFANYFLDHSQPCQHIILPLPRAYVKIFDAYRKNRQIGHAVVFF